MGILELQVQWDHEEIQGRMVKLARKVYLAHLARVENEGHQDKLGQEGSK